MIFNPSCQSRKIFFFYVKIIISETPNKLDIPYTANDDLQAEVSLQKVAQSYIAQMMLFKYINIPREHRAAGFSNNGQLTRTVY